MSTLSLLFAFICFTCVLLQKPQIFFKSLRNVNYFFYFPFYSLSLGGALEHFGYKAPDLQFFYESIWYNLSRFENWFMDRRGGYLALFTRNRYFRLPAPNSPESDSSEDDDEGPTRLPTSTIVSTSSIATSKKTRYNVSPVSWASTSPTIILTGSDLGNPADDQSLKKDGSPKATADVSLGATVAIPVVAGSSSPMEQSSITITNPAVSTSVQTVVATGSTTQPMPADVKLAVLSYGDVKSNLPPIGSLIQQGKIADSTTATSATDSVRSDFDKTLLTLAQEASKMYALSGDGAPINTGFPVVDGQNIVTTTTYSLGGSSIGNLSPRGQQMNWLRQSTKEALETARSQPYPSTRGRGRSTRKRSSSKRQVEKPNTPPTSDE